MTKIEKIKKHLSTYLCVALFVGFLFAVFAPMEIYLANKDFFFFAGSELWGISGLGFLVLALLVLLILTVAELIGEKVTTTILGISFGLILAFYIQGNFLPGDYGSLDGTSIDWNQYAVRGVISVAMFFIVVGLTVVFSIKAKREVFEKIVRVVAVCIVLVQFITLVTLFVQKGGLAKSSKYYSTTENEFNYSAEENLVILMLDSFDATVLNKVISEDTSGEYASLIKDFNFYPDTSGMYKSTVFALPYLMNGVEYLNDSTYEEYLEKGYAESPVLDWLKENNWYIGIYNHNRIPASDIALKAENCKKLELTVSSHRRLGEYMMKLVGFRYMPQPLKKYFWFYGDDINTELMDTKEDVELYSDVNFIFAEDMAQMTADSDRKTYHFYELLGAHPPYYITSDFIQSDTETDTYETAKGMLRMINNYTSKLKECGIYDNTTIIVLADHGTDVRCNPLFMIKYANTEHDFNVEQTPFSYSYLQELYIAVLDGKNENECSDMILAHKDELRNFLVYEKNYGMNDRDYFTADIYRYIITGTAYDNDSIQIGSEVYKCVE